MGRSGAPRLALRAGLIVLGVTLAPGLLRAQQDTTATDVLLQVAIEGGPARVLLAYARDSSVLLPVRAVLELAGIGFTSANGGTRVDARIPPALHVSFDGGARLVVKGDSARAPDGGRWLWRGDELYLAADVMGWALGVEARMDWADLSLTLTAAEGLPVMIRLARDARRAALLRRELPPPPAEPLAQRGVWADGAVLDWSLTSSSSDPVRSSLLQLGLGLQLLGGSLEVQQMVQRPAYGPSTTRGSWTGAWPEQPWLRQARVGDVLGAGPDPRSLRGVVLTNAPYLRGADFGIDALAGRLPAGWEVELYRGGQLVGFSPADSIRRFRLDVPVTYGPNPVDVVLYGPHGEVVRRSRTFFVPGERLPAGRFEYAFSAGACRDEPCRRAADLDVRYGVSERVTAEAGLAYQARDSLAARAYPYALVSAGLTPALSLSAQAVSQGLLRGRADFDPGPDLHVGVEHARFDTTAQALMAGRLAGRTRTTAELFWRPALLGRAVYLQGSLARTAAAGRRSDLSVVALNLVALGVRMSVGARRDAERVPGGARSVSSGLDGSVQTVLVGPGRLLRSTFVRGELRTECSGELATCAHTLVRASGTVGRQLLAFLRLDLGATWQRGWSRPSFDVSLTTALPALRAVSHNYWDPVAGVSGTQVLEGSVLWNRSRHSVDFGNGRSLGRAGIAGEVFFDENGNGVQDPGEPGQPNVLLRVGSRAIRTDSSGRFEVLDLVSFERTTIALDSLSLGNPTWLPAAPLLSVAPAPNSIRHVPIPVVQGGEVSGRVLWPGHERALGGVRVVFRDQATGAESATQTFSDGAFYAMGLRPGRYWVYVDLDQLQQLHLRADAVDVTIGSANLGQLDGVTLRLEYAGPR